MSKAFNLTHSHGGADVIQDQLLLRPEDAAELLDVSRTTVFMLIGSGELESVKIGRARRIPRQVLEAYVNRLRAEQAGTPPAA